MRKERKEVVTIMKNEFTEINLCVLGDNLSVLAVNKGTLL